MDERKIMEELGEKLCDYCPLEDCYKGSHLYPSGHSSCEGSNCDNALEHYLEENEVELESGNDIIKCNETN